MPLLDRKSAALAALGLGLLASVGFAKGVDARTASVVAQSAAPENSNKEKILDLHSCRNWTQAIRAFNGDFNDLGKILKDVPTTDDLYSKVVEIRTQLTDARVTAEKRISTQCPGFKG